MFINGYERKRLGGTCYIEFQYCGLLAGTPPHKLVSVGAIKFWKDDSLYVSGDDQSDFFDAYKGILTSGVYGDFKTGVVDLWGINYWAALKIHRTANRRNLFRHSSQKSFV